MKEITEITETRFRDRLFYLDDKLGKILQEGQSDGLDSEKLSKEKLRKLATFFEDNSNLDEFIRNELGVCGGGFGLAHRSQEEFILLEQSKHLPSETGIPIIDILYLSEAEDKSVSYFIDLLFIGRRSSQNMVTDPPEIFFDLPPESSEHSLPKLPFDEALRGEGKKFLYCTEGEVLFSLYAWRWLVRFCQMQDGTTPVNPSQRIEFQLTDRDFWTEIEEDPSNAQGLPELLWIKTENEKRKELKALREGDSSKPDYRQFLELALAGWDQMREQADTLKPGEDYDFYDEWEHLCLLDENRATLALRALLRFACYVARKRLADDDLREQIQSVCQEIEEFAERITDSSPKPHLSEIKGQKLDIKIQQLIGFVLEGRVNGDRELSAVNLLRALHKSTRFPILPYFYLGTCTKQVHEHLVCPVLESYKYPARVGNLPSGKPSTPAVVLCLLTLTPIREMNSSWSLTGKRPEHHQGSRLSPEASNRLTQISIFFKHLAAPIIDWGFYGNLVEKDVQETSSAKAQRSLRQQQSHAMGTELVYLSSLLTYVSEVFESGSLHKNWSEIAELVIMEFRRGGGTVEDILNELVTQRLILTELSPIDQKMLIFLADFAPSDPNQVRQYIDQFSEMASEIRSEDEVLALIKLVQNEIGIARDNNRALLRIDSGAVRIDPIADAKRPFVESLKRALTVALSTYFERSYPLTGEAGAPRFKLSMEANFGPEYGRRLSKEKWRQFMRQTQMGTDMEYSQLFEWIQQNLLQGKHILKIKLPDPSNSVGTDGTSLGTTALEVWLQELLLNALKYMRPIDTGTQLEINWELHNGVLTINSHNTYEDKGGGDDQIVSYGHDFLRYAIPQIFPGYELQTSKEHNMWWNISVHKVSD